MIKNCLDCRGLPGCLFVGRWILIAGMGIGTGTGSGRPWGVFRNRGTCASACRVLGPGSESMAGEDTTYTHLKSGVVGSASTRCALTIQMCSGCVGACACACVGRGDGLGAMRVRSGDKRPTQSDEQPGGLGVLWARLGHDDLFPQFFGRVCKHKGVAKHI